MMVVNNEESRGLHLVRAGIIYTSAKTHNQLRHKSHRPIQQGPSLHDFRTLQNDTLLNTLRWTSNCDQIASYQICFNGKATSFTKDGCCEDISTDPHRTTVHG